MLCARTSVIERLQTGLANEGELGGHSILITKIIGEDYVAGNWFGCATNGRKESEIGRDLRHFTGVNWVVTSKSLSLIIGMAR